MAEIQTIAVIGAGAVGRGIAFAAALGGYRTILEDILPSSLRTAAAELQQYLARAADLGPQQTRSLGCFQSLGICVNRGSRRA
jgi:3-hydroxybutyryl-CoA dehydrogenase